MHESCIRQIPNLVFSCLGFHYLPGYQTSCSVADLHVFRDLQVQDAGTQQGLNAGTLFTRSLRVPAIWNFFSATTCPRASYATAASTISG